MAAEAAKVGRGRLLLLAFGDFAFNLFWQSVMLFLLFYYTDALDLPVGAAATAFMAASVWDGIASFAAGVLADRSAPSRGYGRLLSWGAVPLAATFVLAYAPPPAGGGLAIAWVLVTHLLFRTVYAAVNVPYLAMSARVSADAGDRAFLAGARMLFGTAAAVIVALGTVPLGERLGAGSRPSDAYLASALVFAAAAAAILAFVGLRFQTLEAPLPSRPAASVPAALASLMRNRAFVALNLAMAAMIVAVTALNKSVLYWFKYALADEGAGRAALALMGLTGGLAAPLWMLAAGRTGLRGAWFGAAAGAVLALSLFAGRGLGTVVEMQLFLGVVQAAVVGLHFVFWAMLPNTVEFGQRVTGLRVEGVAFGLAALVQRAAIGAATAIVGWTFGGAGYVPNAPQSPAALDAIRWTLAVLPAAFLAVSCGLMAWNPLDRRAHARIVRDLAEGGPDQA